MVAAGSYMSHTFFEVNEVRAYLITFRSHGTWLHGDSRGSIDRLHNRYGSPLLPCSAQRLKLNFTRLKNSPVRLTSEQRQIVEAGIRETCKFRNWDLWTINVRSNHVHAVVSAQCKPEKILIAFKANATRKLKEAGCWGSNDGPWAKGGSKRYLWTEKDVLNAVAYAEYDQGES